MKHEKLQFKTGLHSWNGKSIRSGHSGTQLSDHIVSAGRREAWTSLPTRSVVRVLSDGPTATMETDVLRLHVLDFGTTFQLICDKLTLALDNLNGYYKDISVRVLGSRRIVTNC